MRKITLQFPLFTLLCALFWNCSSPVSPGCADSGGGCEIPNGITVASNGSTISGTGRSGLDLYIFNANHAPSAPGAFSDSSTIGSSQHYSFKDLDIGYYNILAYSPNGDSGLYIDSIPINDEGDFKTDKSLSGLTTFTGAVTNAPTNDVIVYIPGSHFSAKLQGDMNFSFDKLPQGAYTLQAVANAYELVTDESGGLPKDTANVDSTIKDTAYTDSIYYDTILTSSDTASTHINTEIENTDSKTVILEFRLDNAIIENISYGISSTNYGNFCQNIFNSPEGFYKNRDTLVIVVRQGIEGTCQYIQKGTIQNNSVSVKYYNSSFICVDTMAYAYLAYNYKIRNDGILNVSIIGKGSILIELDTTSGEYKQNIIEGSILLDTSINTQNVTNRYECN